MARARISCGLMTTDWACGVSEAEESSAASASAASASSSAASTDFAAEGVVRTAGAVEFGAVVTLAWTVADSAGTDGGEVEGELRE